VPSALNVSEALTADVLAGAGFLTHGNNGGGGTGSLPSATTAPWMVCHESGGGFGIGAPPSAIDSPAAFRVLLVFLTHGRFGGGGIGSVPSTITTPLACTMLALGASEGFGKLKLHATPNTIIAQQRNTVLAERIDSS
jgi:hypothetical protein